MLEGYVVYIILARNIPVFRYSCFLQLFIMFTHVMWHVTLLAGASVLVSSFGWNSLLGNSDHGDVS